ncbi:MAG: hypothetical protein ACRDOE_11390 [Streptosporangiaceae bacterium]
MQLSAALSSLTSSDTRRAPRTIGLTVGHLSTAALPGGPYRIFVDTVALIPGTDSALAGGNTFAYQKPGVNVTAVLLRYGI